MPAIKSKAAPLARDERFTRLVEVHVTPEEIDVATAIECGFKTEMFTWTDTREDGTKIEGNACAGVGSTWLSFTIGGRYFRFDVAELATQLHQHVVDTRKGGE
jgi:hypothetical protein